MKFWSICPKHWQLPSGGDHLGTPSKIKSYRNWLESYGWKPTGIEQPGVGQHSYGPISWEDHSVMYFGLLSPFYLVSSGVVTPILKTYVSAGSISTFWSKYVALKYVEGMDTQNILRAPASQSQIYGRSLRCLTQ